MTHIAPTFDAGQLEAPAPAKSRRIIDDYEAWVTEVWPAFVEAADSGQPFTLDSVARSKNLPDPPHPKSQWGSLPARLQDAGLIRHHGYGPSQRCRKSLVYVWIGVPVRLRELVAARRREERAARRQARADEKRAA
ncbi:hypothetical protein TUSST3_08680 [Streptomyces sp. TUS-ST3]|uniref:hypothetical protein n=1 Tax=Streptomyces sp. TUS-ST3 TaxID=3025591 RepID=UPI0024E17218|nr:hypothetical protein [Streptomyces sp. TUS-ST3]GLP64248.1 hypothetical protein TUSST3_08680 [Streptomyces sp. TUS-ST3]